MVSHSLMQNYVAIAFFALKKEKLCNTLLLKKMQLEYKKISTTYVKAIIYISPYNTLTI